MKTMQDPIKKEPKIGLQSKICRINKVRHDILIFKKEHMYKQLSHS